MRRRCISVIGVASGAGALDAGCADGPAELRTLDILRDLAGPDIQFQWDDWVHAPLPGTRSDIDVVAQVVGQLASLVWGCLRHGDFPLVIGGDHSCAIGTWSGVRSFLDDGQRLGLIWVDAHMDSHTPRTSHSHAVHGMPLACLLGHGPSALVSILSDQPKLKPEDICLVGVRSYESEEARLLNNLGVRVYYIDEVLRRGCVAVMLEARARVSRHTAAYGISIDLDALDPAEEPGVGSPAPGGIYLEDMLDGLIRLHGDINLRALEIVEYNPHHDRNHATAHAVHALVRSLIGESVEQHESKHGERNRKEVRSCGC